MSYVESVWLSNYAVSSMFFHSEIRTSQGDEEKYLSLAPLMRVGSFYEASSLSRVNDFTFGDYKPRTELGKRLIEIRRNFILKGGKLLSPEEIDREIELRRGGYSVGDKSIP